MKPITALLVALVVLVPAWVVVTASAQRSQPTLTGTNDAGDGSTVIPPGEPFEVDGYGFRPGQEVTLEFYEHGERQDDRLFIADAEGRFSYSGVTQWGPYRFRAYVPHKRDFVAQWWFGSYA